LATELTEGTEILKIKEILPTKFSQRTIMVVSDEYKKLTFNKNDDVEKFIINNENIERKDELRAFYFFVIGCLKIERSLFMFDMYKGESPDFKLCDAESDFIIGLEVAKATNQRYEMDMSFVEKQKFSPNTIIETPYYSDERPPSKKSKIAIKKPGEKLTHNGWGDYGEEEALSNTVLEIIAKKIKLLNKPPFKRFSKNELLIDSSYCPFFSIDKLQSSTEILINKYFAKNFWEPILYDKYHIINYNPICSVLVYDVFGEKKYYRK
jgi:hypothetical protein